MSCAAGIWQGRKQWATHLLTWRVVQCKFVAVCWRAVNCKLHETPPCRAWLYKTELVAVRAVTSRLWCMAAKIDSSLCCCSGCCCCCSCCGYWIASWSVAWCRPSCYGAVSRLLQWTSGNTPDCGVWDRMFDPHTTAYPEMTPRDSGVKLTPLPPSVRFRHKSRNSLQNYVTCLRIPPRHKAVIAAHRINWNPPLNYCTVLLVKISSSQLNVFRSR